jgi:hypothetical protein
LINAANMIRFALPGQLRQAAQHRRMLLSAAFSLMEQIFQIVSILGGITIPRLNRRAHRHVDIGSDGQGAARRRAQPLNARWQFGFSPDARARDADAISAGDR